MQLRGVDYDLIKQQNFQLKNEITDLKNGFDLNRDVLKILEDQMREKNPKIHLFYQVISRLTGINNQVMLANIELLVDKNKIAAEKRKLQKSYEQLKEKKKPLTPRQYRDHPPPKQIHLELRDQVTKLQQQILSLNQEKIYLNLQVSRLSKIIEQKQIEEQKKPLIPSKVDHKEKQNKRKQSFEIEKKAVVKVQSINDTLCEELRRQNRSLKKLVEELEYRFTLLANIYQIEPHNPRKQRNFENYQQASRKILERQLNLLMFALNNTELVSDEDSENLKLTITKRLNLKKEQQEQQDREDQKSARSSSCPHKFTISYL